MEVDTDDPEENIVQEFMRISKTLTDAMMGDVEEFFMPTATELPPALQMLEHIEKVLCRPSVKKIIQRLDKKFNQVERAKPPSAFDKVGAKGCKECPKCPYWYKGERGLREHMKRDICSRVAVGQVLRPADPDKIKVDDKIYWATKNLEGAMPRCILRQNILRAELEDDEYEDDDTESDTESVTRCSVCEGKMEGLDNGSDDCYCDYCYDCGERLTYEDNKENDGQLVCNDCYVEDDEGCQYCKDIAKNPDGEYDPKPVNGKCWLCYEDEDKDCHIVSISAEQQAKDDETANILVEENPYDEDGFCKYCGWNSCYPNSHIEYCGYGNCVYIQEKYGVLHLKELMEDENA